MANSCPLRKSAMKKTREEKKQKRGGKEIPIKRVAKQTVAATQNTWFRPLIKEIKEEKEKNKKEPQIILQLPDDVLRRNHDRTDTCIPTKYHGARSLL